MKRWIDVISKDHVLAGMEGGFVQANDAKASSLHRLRREDLIFFYSPGTLFRAGEVLQSFTAIARVVDEAPYQVEVPAKGPAWRRNVTSLPCEEAAIEPLISEMGFIQDKAHWGVSLRRGMFEIGEDDARRIAVAMKADIDR